MSRTYRKKGERKLKMQPYTNGYQPKYKAPSYEMLGIDGRHGKPTFEMKEEIRNANRSFKKGLRQKFKKEIKKELNETI